MLKIVEKFNLIIFSDDTGNTAMEKNHSNENSSLNLANNSKIDSCLC